MAYVIHALYGSSICIFIYMQNMTNNMKNKMQNHLLNMSLNMHDMHNSFQYAVYANKYARNMSNNMTDITLYVNMHEMTNNMLNYILTSLGVYVKYANMKKMHNITNMNPPVIYMPNMMVMDPDDGPFASGEDSESDSETRSRCHRAFRTWNGYSEMHHQNGNRT